MQSKQERMPLFRGGQEHPLFGSRAVKRIVISVRPIRAQLRIPFHFIVVDNEFLLQHLDGIQAVRLLLFRQHDFTEVPFSEHRKEIKVIQPDLPLSHRLRLSVLLLLNHLLLLLGWWLFGTVVAEGVVALDAGAVVAVVGVLD
jgi:hypothetical protein